MNTCEKHQQFADRVFASAGLSSECGGYPTNPDETTAFNAGFQRGCHWAYCAMLNGEQINARWDMADSTAAGNGEQAGWNAAAAAVSDVTEGGA